MVNDVSAREAALPPVLRDTTTTLSGWRAFVNEPANEFTLLPDDELAALTPAQRHDYDDQRMTYHSELVVVNTPTVKKVAQQGQLLTILNRREISARRSLIVSGPEASGKSTAIKMLGKTHETLARRRYRDDRDLIPVVYITAPSKGSPRKLVSELANFLGLELPARTNASDATDAVCKVMTACRTDLVMVDEIHNFNLGTSAGEDMSDHLKYFTEHLAATFVYAGINVESSGLFTGIRGRQISGRSVLTRTGPFPLNKEWTNLVATLDAALRLHDQPPGNLTNMTKYLHQRTGGSISSLSQLVRAGAIKAISTQRERIDRDLLDDISIDYAAESTTPAKPRRRSSA